jgi:hypothetical protein
MYIVVPLRLRIGTLRRRKQVGAILCRSATNNYREGKPYEYVFCWDKIVTDMASV